MSYRINQGFYNVLGRKELSRTIMGSKQTKEESEIGNGQVNNNLIIKQEQQPINIHNFEIIILLYIIAISVVIQAILQIFKAYNKTQKKKYLKRGIDMAVVSKA